MSLMADAVSGFHGLKPVSEFGLKDFWLAVRQDFCSTVRLLAFSSFSLLAQIYVSKVSPECVKIPIKKISKILCRYEYIS